MDKARSTETSGETMPPEHAEPVMEYPYGKKQISSLTVQLVKLAVSVFPGLPSPSRPTAAVSEPSGGPERQERLPHRQTVTAQPAAELRPPFTAPTYEQWLQEDRWVTFVNCFGAAEKHFTTFLLTRDMDATDLHAHLQLLRLCKTSLRSADHLLEEFKDSMDPEQKEDRRVWDLFHRATASMICLMSEVESEFRDCSEMIRFESIKMTEMRARTLCRST